MKWHINRQWHFLGLVAAIVVIALRFPTVMQWIAISGGSFRVVGKIEEIETSRRVKVVRYSYSDGPNLYRGEETGTRYTVTGIPVSVTVATSNPAISTIDPERMRGAFQVSIAIITVGIAPSLLMLVFEIKGRVRRRREAA